MKKLLLPLLCLLFTLPAAAQIEWLSWEEAVERNKTAPKKMLVDVYTEWCGWCKKMDKAVFADPKVSAYIQRNFYAVKLDAEQKADIIYDGHTFKFDPKAGRRGSHGLAIALLDGRMSYPSIVYLDGQGKRISISPGFKPADRYLNELEFIAGGHYAQATFEEFLKTRKR